MNTLIEKAVKTAFILAIPATFIIVAYLICHPLATSKSLESFNFEVDTNLNQHDSIEFSNMQKALDRDLDSIARVAGGNFLSSSNDDSISARQDAFLVITQSADSSIPISNIKGSSDVLQGPSALFTPHLFTCHRQVCACNGAVGTRFFCLANQI